MKLACLRLKLPACCFYLPFHDPAQDAGSRRAASVQIVPAERCSFRRQWQPWAANDRTRDLNGEVTAGANLRKRQWRFTDVENNVPAVRGYGVSRRVKVSNGSCPPFAANAARRRTPVGIWMRRCRSTGRAFPTKQWPVTYAMYLRTRVAFGTTKNDAESIEHRRRYTTMQRALRARISAEGTRDSSSAGNEVRAIPLMATVVLPGCVTEGA